jgi:integrase
MVSFRSPENQAKQILKNRAMHGQEKGRGKRGHEDGIHSIGTEKRYAQALTGFAKWRQENNIRDGLNKATIEQAQAYLDYRKAQVGQKTLNADRHALQKLLRVKIETVHASNPSNALATKSRAYSAVQVEAIAKHQSPQNALATRIAYACGLRAHELHTIQRNENGSYSVTGKGGLKRTISIPKKLERELESRRLETPVKIRDRGIYYEKRYDIGGGQAFSQSFSQASKETLGFSHGAHGLRHSYAQDQLIRYQTEGKSWDEAREMVSKEMGHFRPEITSKYLR